jgi:hypothetical protein
MSTFIEPKNETAISLEDLAFEVNVTPEPHPQMGGRSYTPNFRVLMSIFPDEVQYHRNHGGRRKRYHIPAVEKGKYALLPVYDTFTIIRDTTVNSDKDNQALRPVYCDGIAADLLRVWTQDAPGNASGSAPGIMMLAGDKPTQAELDYLVERQTAYFRWLVRAADEYHIKGDGRFITEDHRRALRWLGSEDRQWYRQINTVMLKRCVACAEEINDMATVCKHCSTNLVKFWRESGVEPTAEEDRGVFEFMRRQKERNAAVAAKAK